MLKLMSVLMSYLYIYMSRFKTVLKISNEENNKTQTYKYCLKRIYKGVL